MTTTTTTPSQELRIQKRDGSYEPFNPAKIKRAVVLSYWDVLKKAPNEADLDLLVKEVEMQARGLVYETGHPVTISQVHAFVEATLAMFEPIVAKGYMDFRDKRDAARAIRLKPDNNVIADYIHVAKYAKYRTDLGGRREVYSETVDRDKDMHKKKFAYLGEDFLRQIDEAFGFSHRKQVLPSMRSMQFAGEAMEKHNARGFNCSFTHIDRPRVFAESVYLLLCGCGVGYSVQWRHIEKLPKLPSMGRQVLHHMVGDSIEGWATAVETLVDGAFAGLHVEFDYSQIRPEGAPIKVGGGRAPGHLPLKKALEAVRGILLAAQGRKLRPIECHDMMCHLALMVRSGGTRRSSLICLFSPYDTEMLYCKAPGQFMPGSLNDQRQMANNSAAILRSTCKGEGGTEARTEARAEARALFDRIGRIATEGFGDPGVVFLNSLDDGFNPCVESSLRPILWDTYLSQYRSGFGFCNLNEINVATVDTSSPDGGREDFLARCKAAAFIGTLQASYTSFPFLGEVSEKIAQRDALLGVGLTGIMDKPSVGLNAELLREGAKVVLEENARVAKLLCIKPTARATLVKPGGTSSLELGCIGSGIHPHHARRFFRRVLANRLECPYQYFKSINPHMVVDNNPNSTDVYLVFPIQVGDEAEVIKNMSAKRFLEAVLLVQRNWVVPGNRLLLEGENADRDPTAPKPDRYLDDYSPPCHSVSATCTVKEGERDEVIEFLWQNRDELAAMSLVDETFDKKYPNAPREEVAGPADEDAWNRLIKLFRPVDWAAFHEDSDSTTRAAEPSCARGGCEI